MSTLPLILSLADELSRVSMATAMSPFSGFDPDLYYYRSPYLPIGLRAQNQLRVARGDEEGKCGAVPTIGKDGFQVCLNVAQFKPSELNVKVVDNGVVVEGKHEEREDQHGYISRYFKRRYMLPKGYEAEKVMSTLSSDGVLTVSVPKPQIEDKGVNERVIQIQQVGPAHLNVKENPEDEKESSSGKEQLETEKK